VRGKRVVMVGAGKSALDTATRCAEANGEFARCWSLQVIGTVMTDERFARQVSSTRARWFTGAPTGCWIPRLLGAWNC
jgi:cation diffusion facilitator CzcD-associated flavoprotein CzcO